jgi:hypothetical protein
MMKMFLNLLAEVITHCVSRIHGELNKKKFAEYFEETLEVKVHLSNYMVSRNVLSLFKIDVTE